MLRVSLIPVLFALLIAACKILPHSIRSDLKGEEALAMLDSNSINFARTPNGSGGTLSFLLKERHNCRVEYWTDDPTGLPPLGAPKSMPCPNDGTSLAVKLAIKDISPGLALNFRITVWPRTLTALKGFSVEYKEAKDLSRVKAGYLIVARYVSPRNSNEIYSYQFSKTTTIEDIKTKLIQNNNQDEPVVCSDKPVDQILAFPRSESAEDAQKRPLHGLSDVNTDGYGRTTAEVHPFFSTRLMQFYDSIDRQQNWRWNFHWEGQVNSFESLPPGYLASLNMIEGNNTVLLKNRLLGNVLPAVESTGKTLRFTPSILYPTEISRYELTIKSSDASKLLLRCQFSIDQETLTVPENFYEKIPAGEYIATLMYETNQIHYKEGANYPPWLITAQDWIHFKINRKM
ncbi:MAG: hypothetical protein NTX25_00615 [Proteobacteria bacterium]|nr:hypothetical protein [Pseudomonadota bacterium]